MEKGDSVVLQSVCYQCIEGLFLGNNLVACVLGSSSCSDLVRCKTINFWPAGEDDCVSASKSTIFIVQTFGSIEMKSRIFEGKTTRQNRVPHTFSFASIFTLEPWRNIVNWPNLQLIDIWTYICTITTIWLTIFTLPVNSIYSILYLPNWSYILSKWK